VKSGKFKILLLAKSGSYHTERFVAELRRQGCRVLVASLERGNLHHFHLKNRGPHRLFYYFLAPLEVRRLIERFRPDVINPHYAAGYGFSAALANLGKRVPIVLNLWGGDILLAPRKSFIHKRKPVLALKAADCVIGDSEYLIEAARRLTPLASSRVIPWGIESRYLALHKSSYTFGNPLKVIVPRTQEKLYNNELIVQALATFVQDGAVSITFTNFGSRANRFRQYALGMCGGKGVHFYNRMPRERFLAFMAEHDIYLSASATDSSPASLIEAMALGLVPMAADIPGVREWLTPESGFLFRQHDAESLRGMISRLLSERDPHTQMRRNNLERVKREALFEKNVAEEIAIMKDLAGVSNR
jgi:glycosyltransferase involved in cell wall biosynthesis